MAAVEAPAAEEIATLRADLIALTRTVDELSAALAALTHHVNVTPAPAPAKGGAPAKVITTNIAYLTYFAEHHSAEEFWALVGANTSLTADEVAAVQAVDVGESKAPFKQYATAIMRHASLTKADAAKITRLRKEHNDC